MACLAAAGVIPAGARAEIMPAPAEAIRHWDVDSGLPSPRVFATASTADGYVWMATYAGLVRFDGVAFTTLTPENAPVLGSSSITALATDRDGMLWIGTEEGQLLARSADGFRTVDAPITAGHRINVIHAGPDGTIWAGTQDGVVAVRGKETGVNAAPELAVADVSHIVIDGSGRPWALGSGMVHTLDGEHWQTRPINAEPPGTATAITACSAGGVWCALIPGAPSEGSRIVRFPAEGPAEAVEQGPWPRTAGRSRIEALLEDGSRRLWCATRGGGVYRREATGQWYEIATDSSLQRADGIALATDADGSVWIGTRVSGVYQVRPGEVQALRLPDATGDHVASTVCGRADGSLWAGTDGSGIVSWRNGKADTFDMDDGLPSLDVLAIAEPRDGRLYAATRRGLAIFDGDRFVPLAGADGPAQCLFVDRKGTLWAGTHEGVVQVRDATPKPVPAADGVSIAAACFAESAGGRLYALDLAGAVHECADGRFNRLPEPFTTDARTKALACDTADGMWLGSYGSGIWHVAGGIKRRWTMQQNQLPSSHVLSLIAVGDIVWVVSENGVFGCPAAEFTRTSGDDAPMPTWRVGEAEGLPEKMGTAGGQPACCLAPDGRIWFPNGRFVTGFLPADIMQPPRVFPPRVERIVVDGHDTPATGRGPHILPAGAGRLDFHFTSPNTVAPQRLTFRHRLVGFDETWVPVGSRRIVSYTGLPPGDYRFEVEARAPMGEWRGQTSGAQVRIPPRLWQRRSVQAAAVLGAGGAIAAAAWAWERGRSRRRLARLELERARAQERQRIARDIHDDLGSGLTEIVMLGDIASRESAESPGAATVRRIADRARNLTRTMDEVVWAVNPDNDSQEGFITYFHRWAQAYLTNAGLRVRWDLPVDPSSASMAADMRHQLFLACKEAAANVVKHAAATKARIGVRADAGGLEIVIEDDGCGFMPGEHRGGNGLKNLRTRLAAVGGECEIWSLPGKGTIVRFHVPAADVPGGAPRS